MKPPVPSTVEDADLVAKRRAQIVAAATDLFAERGFHRTTVKDVAEKAGVSPGLVYLYVREKEDVLLLVLLDVVAAQLDALSKVRAGTDDPFDRVVALFEALVAAVDRHRAAVVLAYRTTDVLSPERRLLVREREDEIADLLAGALAEAMRAGLVRPLDIDVVTHQMVTVAHGWALKSWHFKGRTSLDAWLAATLDLLLAGLATPAGLDRRADRLASGGTAS